MLELRDSRWDFQAEVEDFLLTLETDIRGPSHHTREVALWLNVLPNAVVLGALLEKRVLWWLECVFGKGSR